MIVVGMRSAEECYRNVRRPVGNHFISDTGDIMNGVSRRSGKIEIIA
jgi:hypothetical protein